MISNGESSDPLCNRVNRGLNLVRFGQNGTASVVFLEQKNNVYSLHIIQ